MHDVIPGACVAGAFGPRINGIRRKAELDAVVEKSLRAAALWDEVRDRLKHSALGLSGASSSGCASRARSPPSLKSC